MPIVEFLDLMPATVSHAPFVSRDEFGAPTYGASTDYRARVIYKPTHVRGPAANIVLAKGVVWIAGTPGIQSEDRITLPDGTTPPILAVARIPDENGAHHEKAFFG
jgi:hypothetical protein